MNQVKAPYNHVLPSVLQCVERISARWQQTKEIPDPLYYKMAYLLYQRLISNPYLNQFTRNDDSVIEGWAHQIEREVCPDVYAIASTSGTGSYMKSQAEIDQDFKLKLIEKIKHTDLDKFFSDIPATSSRA